MCRMILRAGERYPLRVRGGGLGVVDGGAELGLVWPPWYPASSEDRARDASTLMALFAARKVSHRTVRRWLDADWGVAGSGNGAATATLDEGGPAGSDGGGAVA